MIFNMVMNMLTVDNISKLFARLICWLLEFSRNKGGKAWDTSKGILVRVKIWIDLFLQVYEDDELTKYEEELIRKAIMRETDLTKIQDILKQATERIQESV